MKLKIRIYVLFVFIIFFLNSCFDNRKDNSNYSIENKIDIDKKDSSTSNKRIIEAYSKSVIECIDSIEKYQLLSANDSCLKYIYVIFGANKFKNMDTLSVAQCSIKLTRFKNLTNNIYKLSYSFFTNDSIPSISDLSGNTIIRSFEYSLTDRTIIKAYIGQETTYISKDDLKNEYFYALNKIENQNFIKNNLIKLHPDFKRLVLNEKINTPL